MRKSSMEIGNIYTRKLSEFAANCRFEQIPKNVVEHAKICLLDSLGCGLFGSTLPWPQIMIEVLLAHDRESEVCIIGSPNRCSILHAPLINGTMIHSFELDDLHKRSIVHLGSVVIPAAMAIAEWQENKSGKDFLAAMIIGYEVGARVGMSVGVPHLNMGWHPTGTNGTFGAAAAAGNLLRLTPAQMVHAFGIAGSQAAGLMASQYSSMVKRFHAGRAAQSGVYGALLAQKGFTGIENILESTYGGFCSTMAPQYDLSVLDRELGSVWETAIVGFKSYSACGSCHTTIDAMLEARKQIPSLEEIDRIHFRTSTVTNNHVGWQYVPDSITTAQMNQFFCGAITLLDGEAFVDQFTETTIRAPEALALIMKMDATADSAIDQRGQAYRHAIVAEVRLKDGRVIEIKKDHAKGSDAFPLTTEEVVEKYFRLSQKVMSKEKAVRIYRNVLSVDEMEDIKELFKDLNP
jgi:aconitate decarboxylase